MVPDNYINYTETLLQDYREVKLWRGPKKIKSICIKL